jgi:hypothetical protein
LNRSLIITMNEMLIASLFSRPLSVRCCHFRQTAGGRVATSLGAGLEPYAHQRA